MKVLSIGSCIYNITANVEEFPVNGAEVDLLDTVEYGSGGAANVAYLLGKYKVDSYIGSIVGDDTYGSFIKKELEAENVHTEYIETAFEKKTPLSLVLINKNKERITNNIIRETLSMKKSEYQFEPDAIYIDGTEYGASVPPLNRYADKITVIGAKKCSQDIVELCKYCKYIIMTKEFAEWASGGKINFDNPGSLVSVYSTLLNKFIRKNIVITLGDKGALYIHDNQIKVMPPVVTDVKDTTGAGDIFRGSFVYALTQGYDMEKAVTFANIAASLSITTVGTREGLPELSDIMVYFNQKYPEEPAAPVTPEITPASTGNIDSL